MHIQQDSKYDDRQSKPTPTVEKHLSFSNMSLTNFLFLLTAPFLFPRLHLSFYSPVYLMVATSTIIGKFVFVVS